jgi:Zn-dependent protease with chaperone function
METALSGAHALLPAALLLAIAVISLGAIEWTFRRALRRGATDPAEGWFHGAMRIQWLSLGCWIAWICAATWSTTGAALRAMTPPGLVWVANLSLLLVLPLAMSWHAQSRVNRLARVLRGVERAPGLGQGRAWRPLAAIVILLTAFAGMPAFGRHDPMALLFLLVCLLLALLVLVVGNRGRREHAPHAVTSGELRDRIVALAARAGVKLRQLYVVPYAKVRMANAFAMQGRSVILTDYLLSNLDRDEVDAVMSHELAHLKLGHPPRMAAAMLGVIAAALFAYEWTHAAPAAIAAFIAGMLGFFAMCRRFELAADAGALALGARAESLISGLAALGRLNHVPARWSRATELALTHPSLERRASALAARAGLSTARVAELLAAPGASSALRYAIPAGLEAGGKVFSTTLKSRVTLRMAWNLIVLSVVAPSIALALLATYAPGPAPRLAAFALALAAAAGACIGGSRVLARFPHRLVRTKLAARLSARGHAAHVEGARLIGVSPGSESRIVEGFYVWDAGFLKAGDGRLDYVGEETSFSLAPRRVSGLELVSGPPAWRRTRCVRLSWVDPDGATQSMTLLPLEPERGMRGSRAAEALFESLEAWRTGPKRDAWEVAGTSFGTPRHVEVTSMAPREPIRPGGIVFVTIFQVFMALVLAPVFHLAVWPWAGPGLAEIVIAAIAAHALLFVPALRHREPARVLRRGADTAIAA